LSGRITSKWTKTTAEAFGDTPAVRKGRLGELFVINALESWGWSVIDYETDRNKQVQQIDIEFKSPDWAKYYSGSIKANMDDSGNIYVYEDWIYKTLADRVFHCNPTTGWMCWYDTKAMQRFVTQHFDQMITKDHGSFLKIKPGDCQHFIKRRKHIGATDGA
jgi:hypothetical protein